MTTPIQLDEFGKAVWKNKQNRELFVERPYEWCDRVIVLHEIDDRRQIVDDQPFSTFDFTDWEPMTVTEHQKVRANYKDIYD